MGHIFSSLFTHKARILMLGLDAAGKTTILHRLRLGEYLSSIPTIGFNVETIKYKNFSMTVWDVGGQDRIRSLWKHYYLNTDALIFVVDSSDNMRLSEAEQELYKIMSDVSMKSIKGLLVFANKQDVAGALAPDAVGLALNITRFRTPYHIQGACAPSSEGLLEGLDALKRMLK